MDEDFGIPHQNKRDFSGWNGFSIDRSPILAKRNCWLDEASGIPHQVARGPVVLIADSSHDRCPQIDITPRIATIECR